MTFNRPPARRRALLIAQATAVVAAATVSGCVRSAPAPVEYPDSAAPTEVEAVVIPEAKPATAAPSATAGVAEARAAVPPIPKPRRPTQAERRESSPQRREAELDPVIASLPWVQKDLARAARRKPGSEGEAVLPGAREVEGGALKAVGQQASTAAGGNPVTYRVKRGDTLFSLSRRYDVSVRSLIDRNALQSPYTIYPGQKLVLPVPHTHVVAPGETLYSLSRRYDIAMSEIARANMLEPPYTLAIGQKLRIPDGGTPASEKVTRRGQRKPAAREAEPAVITVAGRTVVVPAAKPDIPTVPARGTKAPPVPSKLLADLGPAPRRFVWPVQGKVISPYGPKGQGLHNDGINIAAPRGAPVRAAADGIVVYAGDELKGYGTMVLIRHGGNILTAYAHNEAVLVRRGARVRQGQVIARVGSTGNVARPQLHFEVRRGRAAIDPMSRLAKR